VGPGRRCGESMSFTPAFPEASRLHRDPRTLKSRRLQNTAPSCPLLCLSTQCSLSKHQAIWRLGCEEVVTIEQFARQFKVLSGHSGILKRSDVKALFWSMYRYGCAIGLPAFCSLLIVRLVASSLPFALTLPCHFNGSLQLYFCPHSHYPHCLRSSPGLSCLLPAAMIGVEVTAIDIVFPSASTTKEGSCPHDLMPLLASISAMASLNVP
jgi:hypothetical protein